MVHLRVQQLGLHQQLADLGLQPTVVVVPGIRRAALQPRLVSFSEIIATGTEREVFNGYCGAESGMVPVSAIAPSILTAQIEIQKKATAANRPPLLPRPDQEDGR